MGCIGRPDLGVGTGELLLSVRRGEKNLDLNQGGSNGWKDSRRIEENGSRLRI